MEIKQCFFWIHYSTLTTLDFWESYNTTPFSIQRKMLKSGIILTEINFGWPGKVNEMIIFDIR